MKQLPFLSVRGGDRAVSCWSRGVPVHRSWCVVLHNFTLRGFVLVSWNRTVVVIFTPQKLTNTDIRKIPPVPEPIVKYFQHNTVTDTKVSTDSLLINRFPANRFPRPIIRCFQGNADLCLIQEILEGIEGM